MILLLAGLALIVAGGVAGAIGGRFARVATVCAVGGTMLGSAMGIVAALPVLLTGDALSARAAWSIPSGSLALGLDALSAFFLVLLLALAALTALFGAGYWRPAARTRRLGAFWLAFTVLVASMALTLLARNGMVFLVAWEIMTVSSFALVTMDDGDAAVRAAGRTYLIAGHLGAACLLAFFALLAGRTGTMDFVAPGTAAFPAGIAAALFVLAMLGFGTKAGFVPLHVWLPEAHPAAPSHVSALMSGVMVKMGIYGVLRTLLLVGTPPVWWGWTLVAIGVSSGVLGVVFALEQQDIKRLLAYSSVENVGIITTGLGLGVLGLATGSPAVAVLGLAGGLLHVLNHATFKGLLFLGAGAIVHATHTRDIDRLGGLLRRMPWTGGTFLLGSAAIAGLPPLNGFLGELLIYLAAFTGIVQGHPSVVLPAIGAVAGLALMGGLAMATFVKVAGIGLLGLPRDDSITHAHDPAWTMRAPLVALAAGCVVLGLSGPALLAALGPLLADLAGPLDISGATAGASEALRLVSRYGAVLLGLAGVLAFARRRLLARRPVRAGLTWDCGFAAPTPRMQYTASSFVQPIASLVRPVLRPQRSIVRPEGLFPQHASLATVTPDLSQEHLYRPAAAAMRRGLARLHWLQHGYVNLYVLYIVVTLIVLLVWQLR